MKSIKKVLTIAGSDCSGGAGIQADIKTITTHKMYAMSVITALTAQNTTGVFGVIDVDPDFVSRQIDCVFNDIYPDAVKIGMVSSAEIIAVIAERLAHYEMQNIVLDPVMVATSGGKLMKNGAADALIKLMFPVSSIITPNMAEAGVIAGIEIKTKADMECAVKIISKLTGSAILLKGGHLENCADDLLYNANEMVWLTGKRIETENTHGTGCTLSSAIACNLANGFTILESVKNAKEYLAGALSYKGFDVGHGSGPLYHCYNM
ncbi:MAG: bifunctional hydroxymethylpyrimidine kinase/phosphomethylpyrimidine kinase [Clostridia bacterium]